MSIHQSKCPNCGHDLDTGSGAPPEPPVGTWVRDKHGALHQRDVCNGWGLPGFYAAGRWPDMWAARGPLVECGPWGAEL